MLLCKLVSGANPFWVMLYHRCPAFFMAKTMKKNTGKAPSVQLYYKDLYADIVEHPNDVVGAWTKLLCKIWHTGTGRLTATLPQIARIIGENPEQAKTIIEYLAEQKIADIEISGVMDNGKITVISRRARRDCKLRDDNKLRQTKYRSNARSNANVTNQKGNPSSSSSSSPSISSFNKKSIYTPPENTDQISEVIEVWFEAKGRPATRVSARQLDEASETASQFVADPGKGYDWCMTAIQEHGVRATTLAQCFFLKSKADEQSEGFSHQTPGLREQILADEEKARNKENSNA